MSWCCFLVVHVFRFLLVLHTYQHKTRQDMKMENTKPEEGRHRKSGNHHSGKGKHHTRNRKKHPNTDGRENTQPGTENILPLQEVLGRQRGNSLVTGCNLFGQKRALHHCSRAFSPSVRKHRTIRKTFMPNHGIHRGGS